MILIRKTIPSKYSVSIINIVYMAFQKDKKIIHIILRVYIG
jgi:hypothetical protein